MKFLCPSCKAKYQIADDKVSGRSVRMKCRKCGFIIPISEIPPAPPTMPPDEAGWDAPPPVVPRAPAAPVVVSPAGAPAPPSPASPSPSPLAPPVSSARVAGKAPAPPPSSGVAAPPKPEGFKRPTLADVKFGAPKAPTMGPGAVVAAAKLAAAVKPASPGAASPRAPQAPAAPGGSPAPKAAVLAPGVPGASVNLLSAFDEEDDENDDATRIVRGGALADAFGALVGGASTDPNEVGMPADEWFVGINDVPVGPIRLGEIRKRAMIGAITPDSMVWRDGLEAWRPLRTFPELVAVLEESMSSVRASAAPLVRAAPGGLPLSRDGDSFAAAGASGGITGAAVVTDDVAAAGLARGRTPMVAWLAIVVAAGFGLTLGFVWFGKQKPPETVIKYVQVPAKGDVTPVAAALQDTQPGDVAGPASSGAAAKVRTAGGRVVGKAADTSSDKGGGLSGLKGLSALGPSGPGVSGANPGSTPAGGGGQLDAAQTQSTVARYTGSVKRSCWQPSLDARAPDAPTSARVVVTITVGGTGSVQNVTTSGEPRGYPGLASCIAGRVRAWQFPATGSSTTVNVPFVFAAQ